MSLEWVFIVWGSGWAIEKSSLWIARANNAPVFRVAFLVNSTLSSSVLCAMLCCAMFAPFDVGHGMVVCLRQIYYHRSFKWNLQSYYFSRLKIRRISVHLRSTRLTAAKTRIQWIDEQKEKESESGIGTCLQNFICCTVILHQIYLLFFANIFGGGPFSLVLVRYRFVHHRPLAPFELNKMESFAFGS